MRAEFLGAVTLSKSYSLGTEVLDELFHGKNWICVVCYS